MLHYRIGSHCAAPTTLTLKAPQCVTGRGGEKKEASHKGRLNGSRLQRGRGIHSDLITEHELSAATQS